MNIVAIGGGEIGRQGAGVETTAIDREIIALSRKKRPRVLFIPTASDDSPSYSAAFEKQYGERLGCVVEVLRLVKNPDSKAGVARKIREADIVYVGGGNTLKMLKIWRKLGVDKLLERAGKRGAILAGLSAGAICWFRNGSSDSRKFRNPTSKKLIRISGLNLVSLTVSPHHIKESHRTKGLHAIMRRTPGVGVAMTIMRHCAFPEMSFGLFLHGNMLACGRCF